MLIVKEDWVINFDHVTDFAKDESIGSCKPYLIRFAFDLIEEDQVHSSISFEKMEERDYAFEIIILAYRLNERVCRIDECK
jgi:hypothetical protein